MKQLSFIISACSAKCIGEFKDHTIQKIVTDSRVIHNGEGLIFAAMITNRNDGHHFIADAYSKGVRCFLVSKDVDLNAFSDAIFLLVDDTVVALQSLAAAVREQYSIPVIGVTGSNGKTITKEWLNHLLNGYFNIVRSPKS